MTFPVLDGAIVVPAKAGTQRLLLQTTPDSRLRGNDEREGPSCRR
jgi:hypothetical protein